jgi:hypothetical protein
MVGVALTEKRLKSASPAGSWSVARNRMKFVVRKSLNLGLS